MEFQPARAWRALSPSQGHLHCHPHPHCCLRPHLHCHLGLSSRLKHFQTGDYPVIAELTRRKYRTRYLLIRWRTGKMADYPFGITLTQVKVEMRETHRNLSLALAFVRSIFFFIIAIIPALLLFLFHHAPTRGAGSHFCFLDEQAALPDLCRLPLCG